MIEVIFKKDKKANEIIAFFPYEFWNFNGDFTCYVHLGQHGSCNYNYYRSCSKCSPNEYEPLLNELKSIGYDDLKIVKRINLNKFREAYVDMLQKERMLRVKERKE